MMNKIFSLFLFFSFMLATAQEKGTLQASKEFQDTLNKEYANRDIILLH